MRSRESYLDFCLGVGLLMFEAFSVDSIKHIRTLTKNIQIDSCKLYCNRFGITLFCTNSFLLYLLRLY